MNRQGLRGTIVNQALPFLQGVSLKMMWKYCFDRKESYFLFLFLSWRFGFMHIWMVSLSTLRSFWGKKINAMRTIFM